MTMDHPLRDDLAVLIAGAGPTGLTLALDLARRGVRVRIIEKCATFPAGSRGRGIQPRTQEVLDDLGIIEALHAAGSSYPPMRAYQDGAVVWEAPLAEHLAATSDVPYPNPWMTPQWRTTALLRQRLAAFGVDVELETELADFEQDVNGVMATLVCPAGDTSRTERVRAGYVVGADGGHSTVRQRLGIAFEGTTDDNFRLFVADVRVSGINREFWHVWREPAQGRLIVGLCPLGGTDLFQFIAQLDIDGTGLDAGMSTVEELARYFVAHTGRTDIRFEAVTWQTSWRPNARLAKQFRDGRVFLAGDAAHVHPPTGGLGLNTGVQDAYNLGWKLGAVLKGAPAALLDTYEQERWPIAAQVLGLSQQMLDQAISRTGQPGMLRRGSEPRQLGIHYRDGALSCDDRQLSASTEHAVRAGDRAPDAPLDPGVRLFDVFRGPHATLLGFGIARTAQGDTFEEVNRRFGGSVHTHALSSRDAYETAYRTYGMDVGTFVLVRPDGYIGLVTQRPSTVLDYLATIAHRSEVTV